MLQSGDTLAGYRIEAIAGVGGMGVVYRATQTSLDRPVALKVLSSTLVGNRTFRERFRREGRHAAALDHPNIIPVYEAGESNGLMFIAMRLVDGPSLADLVSAKAVSGRETLRIVGAIASALDAAHDAGLVHRDIKPQNILMTKDGHPYLADFGITKGSDNAGLTHSGDFVGSLNYVAPEQIDGKDVTGASDVYSLTAVLFQCLTGAYPYQRETDAALMLAHLSAEPPTLAERGIEGPAALDRVFATGMAKRPEGRFLTAQALVNACRDAVASADPALLDVAPSFPAPAADGEEIDALGAPLSEPTQPDPLTPPARPAAAPAPALSPDLTTADVKRSAPPETAPAAPRPRRRLPVRPLATAAAALLVLGAPVAGYALGHEDPAPAPVASKSRALSLQHGEQWTASTADIDGLELSEPVRLRRADGTKLVAGRLRNFAPGFDPVPQALRARFADKSADTPQSIRLGASAVAVRHAVELRSGERLWLAIAPDSRGWTAVACEGADADVTGGCLRLAQTLDVTGATPVALGSDKRTATALSAVLTSLDRARGETAVRLRAKSTRKRAAAARRLAAAHLDASKKLTALVVRPQEKEPVAAIAKELRAQSGRLTLLAEAAALRRPRTYNAAREDIRRGDARTTKGIERLRAVGYDVGR